MTEFQGDLKPPKGRFVLVVGRFNKFVVDSLEAGAIDALKQHGVDQSNIDIIRVPGAFEIPLACAKAAKSGNYVAVIALGAVIRGGTPHFEFVAGECVKGLSKVNLETEIPVVFGVLTVDTIEQAIDRAGPGAGNKGAEAALCGLEMANLMSIL